MDIGVGLKAAIRGVPELGRRDIVTALAELLRDTLNLSEDLSLFLATVLGVLIVATIPLLIIIGLIWADRKFGGRMQDRMGPNRVGPFGLLQSFADLGKLLIKEDITPANADRFIYNLAPVLSVASVILVWAVVPLAPNFVGVDLNIGVLYMIAVASLGTLAVVMGGWASNNKYALLGGFRAVAQLVSYEIPMVMALLVPVLFLGTGSLVQIVESQASMWFVALSPLAALTFFLASQAEVGRPPFDLIEAESELTAGYNVEYSGMKFGMFMAGEYAHWLTQGVLLAVLFFGGWNGPFVDRWPWLGVIYFFIKALVLFFASDWVRYTIPRLRIDQMMNFNWQLLVPLSIVNVLVTALLLKLTQELGLAVDLTESPNFVEALPMTIIMFLGNLAQLLLVLQFFRVRGRRQRSVMAAGS